MECEYQLKTTTRDLLLYNAYIVSGIVDGLTIANITYEEGFRVQKDFIEAIKKSYRSAADVLAGKITQQLGIIYGVNNIGCKNDFYCDDIGRKLAFMIKMVISRSSYSSYICDTAVVSLLNDKTFIDDMIDSLSKIIIKRLSIIENEFNKAEIFDSLLNFK